MEKKKMVIVVAFLVLFSISSNMDVVESAVDPECYDGCSMGCVNPDQRLIARCDRKCQIRCGPGTPHQHFF
ncbi:hypothetical protein LguiA_027139 [Lonicera macranthoides]